MVDRCCCCPEPGIVTLGYSIMKLDASNGSRIWFNDCKYNATFKPSDLMLTSDGLHVLHSGFASLASNTDSLKYAAMFLDVSSGTTQEQPVITGDFGGSSYSAILEGTNYYWLTGSSGLVVSKSDYTATRVAVGTPYVTRRNVNVAVWGDYYIQGEAFATSSSYLQVIDTDATVVKTINLPSVKRMYAFTQANVDGKIVIWFYDTTAAASKVGIFDLDTETYDSELTLTNTNLSTDTYDNGFDVNGDYAAITANHVDDPLTDPKVYEHVEVFNLSDMTSAHWYSEHQYATGFGYNRWEVGPMRVSSDGSEVARPAIDSLHGVAVFNSSGLKWRKTLTGYTFNNFNNGRMDIEFDSSGNVYTNGLDASSDTQVIKLAASNGAVEWERPWTFTDNPNDAQVSRITAGSDGIYVCGEHTEPYNL